MCKLFFSTSRWILSACYLQLIFFMSSLYALPVMLYILYPNPLSKQIFMLFLKFLTALFSHFFVHWRLKLRIMRKSLTLDDEWMRSWLSRLIFCKTLLHWLQLYVLNIFHRLVLIFGRLFFSIFIQVCVYMYNIENSQVVNYFGHVL